MARKALTYQQRKRWALFILVVGLPLYILFSVAVMTAITRFPAWVELGVYIVLGIGWIFPVKSIFMGIGQADPDAPRDPEER